MQCWLAEYLNDHVILVQSLGLPKYLLLPSAP